MLRRERKVDYKKCNYLNSGKDKHSVPNKFNIQILYSYSVTSKENLLRFIKILLMDTGSYDNYSCPYIYLLNGLVEE